MFTTSTKYLLTQLYKKIDIEECNFSYLQSKQQHISYKTSNLILVKYLSTYESWRAFIKYILTCRELYN